MNCQYCNNLLKNNWSLINHQKTAKYCLKLQEKTVEKNDKFNCNFCGIFLSTKQRLVSHAKSCNANTPYVQSIFAKYEQKISKLDKEITELKAQLQIYKELSDRELSCVEDIARQPRTQNNNTQNNLMMLSPLNLNKEAFAETIRDSFTKDYFLQGQKGVARFAVEKLLRDSDGKLKYVCTDPSRQVYRFKTLDGELERDIKAKKLTSVLAENLTKQSHSLSFEEISNNDDSGVFILCTNNFQDIKEMSEDNGDFRTELASLTTI